MSHEPQTSDPQPAHEEIEHTKWETESPSAANMLGTIVLVLVGILLFGIFMLIAYVPNRPAPLDEATITKRLDNREKLEAEQEQKATSYEVIDKEAGVVRIPIERAMQVVADSLREDAAIPEGKKEAKPSAKEEQ